MRKLLLSLALVVAFSVHAHVSAADWPNFLGPSYDVTSPETGINTEWDKRPPKMLWKVPMGDRGYAGPAVAKGKLFIIDRKGSNDVVRAINIETGEDVWRFSYPDPARYNYGFAQSTPTVDGDKLYTMSRRGMLHCLTAKDGKKVWAVNIIKRFSGKMARWEMAISPRIDGDRIVVCPGGRNATVAVLDKKTGKTIWKGGGNDRPGYATPVVATIEGKKQYVLLTSVSVIGVDAASGKLLWTYPWRVKYDVNATTPIISGDEVLVSSSYKKGSALLRLKDNRPTVVWQNKTMQSHFNTPILRNGRIYGSTSTGRMVCLDWKTGKTLWQTRGFERGGVVGVAGTIIALDGKRGGITMFKLADDRCTQLGRMKGLGGQSWTAPIVADGKLIVRNKKQLACYSLK